MCSRRANSCVQNRMRKHPWYAFHVFIPTNASSFTMFHPWIFPPTMPLGHCIEPVQPRGFLHQVHDFCVSLLSRIIQGCFAWEPQLTFEVTLSQISLQVIAERTAGFDVWKPCAESAVSFFSLAHTDVKDMDEL